METSVSLTQTWMTMFSLASLSSRMQFFFDIYNLSYSQFCSNTPIYVTIGMGVGWKK